MSRSEVKGQGHQRQFSSQLKMHCNARAANDVMQQQTGPFVAAGDDVSAQRRPACGLCSVEHLCSSFIFYFCVRFQCEINETTPVFEDGSTSSAQGDGADDGEYAADDDQYEQQHHHP